MSHLHSCFLLAELALVVVAGAWSLARLVILRRQTGGYGLSDAMSAGAVGGLIGMAAGGALCVLEAARADGRWFAWAARLLPFGGLALLEGAAVGVAVAFLLARPTPRDSTPPDDSHNAT